MFCFVLTSSPQMLCVYFQTLEAALFWKKKKKETKSICKNQWQKKALYKQIIIIIIIMVIFKCYFSGEHIALSIKIKTNKQNNNGVNIELGKTNRL